MKYAHYIKNGDGISMEGVCHRSKLETLATPGCTLQITMISDEDQAKLVDKWGGVETAPAKPVEPTKKTK